MSQNQGTVLRSGKIFDSSSETAPVENLNMAQSNSNDSDTNDSSDISSQLSEKKRITNDELASYIGNLVN